MVIGIIGAGKAGTTLGKYLMKRDVAISGFYSRNEKSAKESAEFTKTRAYNKVADIIKVSDTLFITTPDGEIANIWDCITAYQLTDKTICHFSGSLSSAVFEGIDKTGARGCSIHPMYAFSDKFTSYRQFSKAILTMEGDLQAVHIMKNLFEALGHKVMTVQAEDKMKYHAAAALASNYMLGLFQMSVDLLKECGFEQEDCYTLLGSLVRENIATMVEHGTEFALTGPIERNDIETVKKHLTVCSDSRIKNTYCNIGQELIDIAQKKYPNRDYTALRKILSESD